MTNRISPLASVDPKARLGDDIEIGPFCLIGPHVTLGDGCRLDSHVVIIGHTIVGERNRFSANAVIGGEPQDIGYSGSPTKVIIGDDNVFREGVTVNRGADKEDGITRIGHRNFLMANSHVAHNCHVHSNSILSNGVLLGGHVHIHDHAIVSGNSVVHHFATLGTGSFLSGGCRAPQDIPPYMLAAGSDNPEVVTVNVVGMRRRGISESSISLVRQAFKSLFRDHKKVEDVRSEFLSRNEMSIELATLLNFVEWTAKGKNGRGREAIRNQPQPAAADRRAA